MQHTSTSTDRPPGRAPTPARAGLAALLAVTAVLGAAGPAQGATSRVSLNSSGVQGNGFSDQPAVSGDGTVVAFASGADNLVPGDTNEIADVFVHDRRSGRTERVNVSSTGAQAQPFGFNDALSSSPAISADGSRVAFHSRAGTLVEGDTNGTLDIFVHDRPTGTTRRVSVASDGTQADGYSQAASISADGTRVAFFSNAANLVAGDDNGMLDVFVHDLQTGETRLASRTAAGTSGDGFSAWPAISGDGRRVTFVSGATDLAAGSPVHLQDAFVHDLGTGVTERVSVADAGQPAPTGGREVGFRLAIDADGTHVAFSSSSDGLVAGDTNGTSDVFLRDVAAGTTRRVSVSAGGGQGAGSSVRPSISGDGQVVAFEADAPDLVDGDTNGAVDVFVHDRTQGTTVRASVSSAGQQATSPTQPSTQAALSADGRTIGFASLSQFFAAGDSNGTSDVFAADVVRVPAPDPDPDPGPDPDPDPDPEPEGDRDGDGIADGADNAPDDPNPGQEDLDEDGLGDVADPVVLPVRAEDCKRGGWRRFHEHGTRFRNQRQCVSSVARDR